MKISRRLLLLPFLLGVLAPIPAAAQVNPNRINQLSSLKAVPIAVAHQTVSAWLMDNESRRQEGVMFLTLKDVKENQGMLFLFPMLQSQKNGFWMANCPLGLDIIYIGKDRKVVTIGDGVPQSTKNVYAAGPYQYVLEVRRGWARRHSLKKGDLVAIPASLKSAD